MSCHILLKDFTYSEFYLEKYVLAPKSKNGNGGAGLERHDFHHLVKQFIKEILDFLEKI